MTINKNNNPTPWNRLFFGRSTAEIPGLGNPSQPLDTMYLLGSKNIIEKENARRPRIAIVGTRDMSPYGKNTTERIIQALSVNPLRPAIVSGLAYGIDACAHEAALQCGLPTIAVMATGLDTIYPRQHQNLAERIIKHPASCLLTPFPEGTAPMAFNFIKRNDIMALICDAVIVVEAKSKGGSLIVARYAYNNNIPVYAVPGRVDDIRSQGCNELIKNETAQIITDFDQLSKPSFFKI